MAQNMSNQTEMSVIEQEIQQRGSEVTTRVTKLSTMISSGQEPEEWRKSKMNDIQDVVDRLGEQMRTTDSREKVLSALNSEDTRRLFEERVKFNIINEEDFNREDVAQDDRDNYREASSMVSIISEQIKGIVHDTWTMHIEEEE